MAKNNEPDVTRVITPKFRVSFPSVFKPTSFNNQPAKFSVQMLFDKKVDLSPLKKAAAAAVKAKYGDKPPKGLHSPFKDGNEKELEGYENTIVVTASSKFKPGLIDANKNEILAESDFYPGCYARAEIKATVYEVKGENGAVLKKGVSFQLNNIQKLGEGENLGGRKSAEDVFDSVSDGSSDSANYGDDLFGGGEDTSSSKDEFEL